MIDRANLKPYTQMATERAANALMDAEAAVLVNAALYERSDARTVYRNGYRTRRWHTAAGVVALHIPKLRSGSYYPAFLDNTAAAESIFADLAHRALTGALHIDNVRPLLLAPDDDTVAADVLLAFTGAARTYLTRKLRYPYPVLAIYTDGAHVFIYGERATGTRQLLDVRENIRSEAYWQAVFREMAQRGLTGVEAVTGDDVSEDIHRAARAILPEMAHEHTLPQHVVAALGLPLERPTINRERPLAMLEHMTDAALTLTIDVRTLGHLRRLMRDERDAIGEPLRRVA
ncbi:MAG: transposase [Chloroflexota bacterium]